MRTIEVTVVAPAAWACCKASRADAACRVPFSHVGDRKLEKLAPSGPRLLVAPGSLGRGWCLNWRPDSRAAGHRRSLQPAGTRLRSTPSW